PAGGAAIAAIAALAGDPARRSDAISALAGVPESAIPRVGDALSSRDARVRRAVIEALGRLTHPAASAYVLTALSDSDASVRQLAVTVLSRLGTRGLARSFADLAAGDPSDAVRHAAQIALRRIGKEPGDAAGSPDRQ
ncbi:MAG: lyase domain protein repeat-containing protein, partial [Acidobacteria bacterium]|nr:lyase domain protein repeat-containing protein [Acidobacteriota bacterium]